MRKLDGGTFPGRRRAGIRLGVLSCLALLACLAGWIRLSRAETRTLASGSMGGGSASQASVEFNPRLLRRFSPVRPVMASDPARVTDDLVTLGRLLFFDERLSKSQKLSCNSCHSLDRYGVDGTRTSTGHKGQRGARNAPTVYNAAAYAVQFWDGRAADIESQAMGPILNPVEMAMPSAGAVEKVLRSIPGYLEPFKRAFPGEAQPITFANTTRAIGAFERRLSTPSRWDRYLTGQKDALTVAEKEGLRLFTNLGCMVCHTGETLGGTAYQRVGAVEQWPNQKDQGRFEVTKLEADRMMFKVPTLRNIEKTAPYFHDGSGATLSDAVKAMGRYQLGLDLSADEVTSIVTWLKSLTGELPRAYIAAPLLPKSGRETPRPDPN